MQVRGPLMIEHRLIERMIALIKQELMQTASTSRIDPLFIDTVVDFIRTYADRTHHGKEEDILFRHLAEKNVADHHRRVINELVQEHALGRKLTGELVEANARYREGDHSALKAIIARLETLSQFYPKHIEKEDKDFFPACRAYFSGQEEQSILEEFWEFDRRMIHEKYASVVQKWEKP